MVPLDVSLADLMRAAPSSRPLASVPGAGAFAQAFKGIEVEQSDQQTKEDAHEERMRIYFAINSHEVVWLDKYANNFEFLDCHWAVLGRNDNIVTRVKKTAIVRTSEDGTRSIEDISIEHKLSIYPTWGSW